MHGQNCAELFGILEAKRLPGDSFKFQKRSQQFSRLHNETLSVVAMRVSNRDRSPFTIHGGDAAPTPTGFAEIVSDDFPILYTILPLAGPTY
jgi:hypothetical protein